MRLRNIVIFGFVLTFMFTVFMFCAAGYTLVNCSEVAQDALQRAGDATWVFVLGLLK